MTSRYASARRHEKKNRGFENIDELVPPLVRDMAHWQLGPVAPGEVWRLAWRQLHQKKSSGLCV
jgi:hypothetical protein